MRNSLYAPAAVFLSLLISGCGLPDTPIQPLSQSSRTSSATSTAAMSVEDPQKGAEMSLGIGEIEGANNTLANGSVTAQYFGAKGTIVRVQLNIAQAGPGMQYIAWLRNSDGQATKIGALENKGTDVRHSVGLESDIDLRKATNLIITLEQNDVASPGSQIVATGNLIEIHR